ncbi:hypothetical protein ABB37_00609 [Leptomonas pyrrhocoris]|uniref:Cullin family profile domain-containing protein n=1 Tax=Leptomonas pyrrhocoris TaxID=157538 RepID=A0A0M9GAZ4_LEPPY|nr:hypothetical protein ABB37_00609 [Leptomonas pyrrhocoris]KPA86449.1 hypothetical protein ABB37_00609 [Leptomonas pyrrhocoris]|eukprot:XP_015664888.1 hypothetical protein ABB37_00609 [Leptomonas pyrrhocoris]
MVRKVVLQETTFSNSNSKMSDASTVIQNTLPGDTSADPFVSTSASLLLNNSDEDAALQVFAELLDFINTEGIASLAADRAAAQRQRWRSALSTLSSSVPLNGMIAETLLERVNAAFAVHIRAFQDALQQRQAHRRSGSAKQLTGAVVGPALAALCTSYDHIFPLLQEWCDVLRVPGVASFFSVHVRCALLQADLISGEEPRRKRAFFAFLRQHGHALLSRDPCRSGSSSSSRGAEEDKSDVQEGREKSVTGFTSYSAMDPVIACLHRLTLSQSTEVKQLWRSVLEARIREKLSDLSDDFSTHFLQENMLWLEQCVMPFGAMVLGVRENADALATSHERKTDTGGADSATAEYAGTDDALPAAAHAEREAWCADMRKLFLHSYARRRLDSFWEILSDYPDSVPALEDMQYCLQANPESGLKTELIHTVRHLLSSRLHRAGTRTEDILAILINTIHAFCVLFPRNEQDNVVFDVIANTLEHLRRRKDCVAAIVQAVMQPNGVMNAAAARPPPPPPPTMSKFDGELNRHSAGGDGVGDAMDFLDSLHDRMAGGREEELYRTNSRDRPDVLRVLLTSIHRRALVEEYQHVLAEQLLQKPMHEFDTTPEEEVLERLKQVFGETVLDKCSVMVRDMQMSRRVTQQLREQLARRRGAAGPQGDALRSRTLPSPIVSPAAAVVPSPSVSVLSMTTWPPLARCAALPAGGVAGNTGAAQAAPPVKYRPHPSLQGEMDLLAEAYKKLKDNQRLAWLPSLGRVELELMQRDAARGGALVTVTQVLSLFDASVVLFVKEMANGRQRGEGDRHAEGAVPAVALSEVARALEITSDELRPHVQRLSPAVLVMPTTATVDMQRSVAALSDFVFMEDKATSEAEAKPAGLPPERVKLMERMVTSLLKTRGPQAGTAIHNSVKLLAKFEGTNADLLELLQSFVKRGLIVLNDAKLYALPPK